jgi:hypothetical protein
MMKRLVGLYIAWLVAAVMLVIALVKPIHPSSRRHYHGSIDYHSFGSDFYTLLRWACCIAFAYSAVRAFQIGRASWTWIFAVLAVLFNPIAPIHLQRATWQVIDGAALAVLPVAAAVFWRSRHESPRTRDGLGERL